MRECRRVLRPGGSLAGFVVHMSAGLAENEQARAIELGPTALASPAPFEDLLRDTDLHPIVSKDVSAAFLETIGKVLSARQRHEEALLDQFGPEEWEEELARVERLRTGVRAGLLSRSLMVATRNS